MSEGRIGVALRRLVATRAALCCEYCCIAEADTVFGCQVDHVVSEKHGGATVPENLAYACVFCNRHKGSDIASLDETGTLTPLFHPRRDAWPEHFGLDGPRLVGRTTVGRATIRLLRMNAPERIVERELLQQAGRFGME